MGDEMIFELIQRDLDHDLSPAEKERLLKHLSHAPEDAMLAEQFHQLSQLLDQLPQVAPPISVVDQILPQIEEDIETRAKSSKQEQQKRSSLSRHRLKWIAGGSFVAAAALIGVMIINTEPLNEQAGNVTSYSISMKSANQQRETAADFPSAQQSSSQANTEMDQANDSSHHDARKKLQAKAIWSPHHKYQASWENHQLMIRDADGKVQFTSEIFPDSSSTPQIKWQSDSHIQLVFSPSSPGGSSTPVTYDIEQKKRVK